ncbi:hypothetical protein [Arthrobacter koreensis]|uniref:hypothetical protein n=1 Tax=Arthrobacter koreensis TaxID=199136 RepID=UPI003802484B
MGKRLQMAPTGEFILWAVIPEGPKSSYNRAYGPFLSRSAAYSAKAALINTKRAYMQEEGYTPEEIEEVIENIEWSTTGLWRKVEADHQIDPVAVIPDTPEERAAEAMWNRSGPVVRGARPTWDIIRTDPAWAKSVQTYREDARAAISVVTGTAGESAEENSGDAADNESPAGES